jgi:hypothetical protein
VWQAQDVAVCVCVLAQARIRGTVISFWRLEPDFGAMEPDFQSNVQKINKKKS